MLRPFVDILMTLILLISMTYEKIGPALETLFAKFGFVFDGYEWGGMIHEWFGMTLIILFFVHLWLNRWWLKGIFRGRYSITRTVLTLANVLLIIDVIFLLVSGLLMARTLGSVELEETDSFTSFARQAHIVASFWGYILMSFHAGLNWHIFSAMMFKAKPKIFPHVLAIAIMIYGAFAFVKRQLWDYMTMNIMFVFFDYDEPILFFILDYIAIMILFACLGHYLVLLLRRVRL
ncbi:MAG: DUF4405 domain-containing protein [Synergistaceae bacterium]|nr:DUF4405 domain-containing protein [Synergistaceae bacterium]